MKLLIVKKPKTHIYITNKQNHLKINKEIKDILKKSCNEVLYQEKFKYNCEISITLVDDKTIKEINKKYRDKDEETDVLSFPLGVDKNYDFNEKREVILGDIVISIETALNQARMYNNTIKREIAFLTVHSMLHLLDYDHEKSEKIRKEVREKEETILKKLNLYPNTGFKENELK